MLWVTLTLVFLMMSGGQGQDDCLHGDILFKDGDLMYDDCFPCWCANGSQRCYWQTCENSEPMDTCVFDGEVYLQGEQVPVPCLKCFCLGGMAMCAKLPCFNESLLPSSSGQDCGLSESIGCGQCYCVKGLSLCSITDCPDDSASETCHVNGLVYRAGALIPDPEDTCTCFYGTVHCIRGVQYLP
ncbi:kielin/chordin-like protein isoform X2 [Biomphalaria pfeifferi]|uniref:Kielin/chordin-like protein isoform X2 n=1 Tax=Biomphalaria pfeifferi TaxID=112525 RepID=A0AAD8BJP7_BIOPF|nr:kielin/chordin-like protein isoform X2 [Biomphalaria pfeifferi]